MKIDVAKNVGKAGKYMEAYKEGGDAAVRDLMDDEQLRYAEYLMTAHGWDEYMALQRAYIWGYDPQPYDYSVRGPVDETEPRSAFFS